jgi:actin-related protein 6
MDELVFELYGFKEYCSTPAAVLSNFAYQKLQPGPNPVCVIVDSGYSFTHVVPLFDNFKVNYAIKRVDVGGKVLTNYLKELMTYREYNMMEETYLMDEVKKYACFVSGDFDADMAVARQSGETNTIKRQFVLPDYTTDNRGYIRGDTETKFHDKRATQLDADLRGPEQVLTLNNERFTVCPPSTHFPTLCYARPP